MIPIKPSPKLLFLPAIVLILGLVALQLTGLTGFIRSLLALFLLIFIIFQTLGLMQLHSRTLCAFALPQEGLWKLKTKKGRFYKARLLASTRITSNILILHFKVEDSTLKFYQIILPQMIGQENFQQLLIDLKIKV